ncbi:MAG: DUF4406 domain-containing protein [Prevotella sp.]|nr:DUF4406 domain-containing protein [Prevotella sp.]
MYGFRIYISGKIGEEVISEATRQKFAKAEELLKECFGEENIVVINPACDYIQEAIKMHYSMKGINPWYEETLLYMLHWLETCTAIYMLPDFLDSPGAKAEHAFAIATKKKIFYADELFKNGTLRTESFPNNRLPEVKP